MLRPLKRALLAVWVVERAIRLHIRISRTLYFRVPLLGRAASLVLDRLLLVVYGINLMSASVDVRALSISHRGSILLGGNGIVSPGSVAVTAGAKLVGRSPNDPDCLRRQAERRVLVLGDSTIIVASSVVVVSVDICDIVTVGAMSLVKQSFTEPGVYVGLPAREVKDAPSHELLAQFC